MPAEGIRLRPALASMSFEELRAACQAWSLMPTPRSKASFEGALAAAITQPDRLGAAVGRLSKPASELLEWVRSLRAVALELLKNETAMKSFPNLATEPLVPVLATATIEGRLKFADDTRETANIKLVDERNKTHLISVPEGMMTDIVKPLWDTIVVVN